MKLYIIRHKPSGHCCYSNTPYNDGCFSDGVKHAPRFFESLKLAKTAMSRGLNNCKTDNPWLDEESLSELSDWFNYLLDTEIVEVKIDINSGTVVHRAVSQMEKK